MSNEKKSFASIMLERDASMRSAVSSSSLYNTLRTGLKQVNKQVNVDGEQYYVAEGDILLDEDQLGLYTLDREKIQEARALSNAVASAGLGTTVSLVEPEQRALVGISQDGKFVRWAPNMILSYRVVRNTFTNQERYDLACKLMKEATENWENTCGVKFEHRADLDTAPGTAPNGALFAVREINANGAFIAAAFFPNDPPFRRKLLIDPSFYRDDLGFNKTGVLRHELGHVLGFRHEHIRSEAPPACPDEPLFDASNLTKYDPQSVMHYFCGDVGSPELQITKIDEEGSRRLYGPPLNTIEFIDA
jgi:hypothetical protein